MLTSTTTTDPATIVSLYEGISATGPVAGVWTVTAPDTMGQATLDSLVALIQAGATASANEATLRAKAATALASNATFQAIASPTQAQALAQVKDLTRQVNALIKLATQSLSDTTGT